MGGSYESLEHAGCMQLQVQEEMRNGEISLEKYVITKTLKKPPEAYPDARSQPHVEVSPKSSKYFKHSVSSFHV